MESCPKCLSILKVREGTYSSELGSPDVYFTQLKCCDNKECSNNQTVLDTIKHKMN